MFILLVEPKINTKEKYLNKSFLYIEIQVISERVYKGCTKAFIGNCGLLKR